MSSMMTCQDDVSEKIIMTYPHPGTITMALIPIPWIWDKLYLAIRIVGYYQAQRESTKTTHVSGSLPESRPVNDDELHRISCEVFVSVDCQTSTDLVTVH